MQVLTAHLQPAKAGLVIHGQASDPLRTLQAVLMDFRLLDYDRVVVYKLKTKKRAAQLYGGEYFSLPADLTRRKRKPSFPCKADLL